MPRSLALRHVVHAQAYPCRAHDVSCIMARVLAVPSHIWNRLHKLWVETGNFPHSAGCLCDDANNEDTMSEALLAGRQERALEKAESIGADVWDFVVSRDPGQMYLKSLRKSIAQRPPMHYFFIAKDEKELEDRVSVLEIMAI